MAVGDNDEPFAEVAAVRVDEKDAIAERAAALVEDGDTVLLDIGTTAHRLARRLRGRPVTVITNSLAVYEELRDDHSTQLVVLGGMVRRSYRSLVGFLTEDALRQVHAETAFLGASGVRSDGHVLDTTAVEVPAKRGMIAAAERVVLLADASKFPGRGMARVCGPEELDIVVTDAPAKSPALSVLARRASTYNRPREAEMTGWVRAMRTGAACVALAIALTVGVQPAEARDDGAGKARDRAGAAVEAMMGFYDGESGRWDPAAPWWQSGNALQALLDYMAKTRSNKYMWAVENTVEQQRKPLPWWPEGGGEFRADSTDDTGWWALAMIRLYDLTRDREYLDIARIDEAYIRDYWDDVCGGGVWWDIPAKTYKNAISIELYIKLAASLHNRIRGDRVYLERAVEAWEWFSGSGMINGEHLVNDGLQTQSGRCDSNLGTTWTYNQGVVLGGLTELFKATRDRGYLSAAKRIADAVIASPALSPGGILTEPCEPAGSCNADQAAFKGITSSFTRA